MMRPMPAAAVLLLALPAAAQDFGGVRLRSPAAVLDRVVQASASGCRLSTTSVTERPLRNGLMTEADWTLIKEV